MPTAASSADVPHPRGDPGEVRGTERRRLPDRRAPHGHAEHVGLELAQQVHHRRAAVDAQLGDRDPDAAVIASTTSRVCQTIDSTTARGQVRAPGAAR